LNTNIFIPDLGFAKELEEEAKGDKSAAVQIKHLR
jgi:hypothetical protein